MRHWTLMLLLPLLATELPADSPSSRVVWLDLGGKGGRIELSIADGWPLSHFTTHMPWWDPVSPKPVRLADGSVAYASGEDTPTDRLFWRPLKELAEVMRLGRVGGIRTYQIAYSRAYHVVVWDRGGWLFVPAVLIAGDESIVSGIHTGRVFQFEGKDILHVRIQLQGTGHYQESLFFTALDGRLVILEREPSAEQKAHDFLASRSLRPFHRGAGFCEGTLTEERMFEGELGGDFCRGCRYVIRYSVKNATLVVRSIGFADEKEDCEPFPKW